MLRDRLAQERVALLGSVAPEAVLRPELVDGAVHRVAHGLRQREHDVTDAEPDQPSGGVTLAERVHSPGRSPERGTRLRASGKSH